MAMMDELIQAVGRAANLPPEQAALAVGAMLRFLAARMPSPLVGELQSRLRSALAAGTPGPPSEPEAGA